MLYTLKFKAVVMGRAVAATAPRHLRQQIIPKDPCVPKVDLASDDVILNFGTTKLLKLTNDCKPWRR